MLSIQERILKVVDTQYNGIKKKFCEKMNINESTLSTMIKRNTNPSFELIYSIITTHEGINAHWLITGEGDMNDSFTFTKHENCEDKLEAANKEIEYLKEINKLLREKK